MKRLYLIQPEITSGPINEHYLPYSVGCIWAYANQFNHIRENIELKGVVWRRDRQKNVLERVVEPDIVGFSNYVWNHNWNLTLAKKIKDKWPNCLIVFGGPSINEDWLKYNFIDVLMFGEAEEAWEKMLNLFIKNDPIPRYWKNNRQLNIENYPSPYTTGFFDKIIEENPDVMWFMMLETNRGCPYHCTFCGWGAEYLNKLKVFDIDRVNSEIEWAATHNIHWMFVIDANSGILKERDTDIAWTIRKSIEKKDSNIRRVTFNHAKNLNYSCFEMEEIIQNWTYGLEIAIQSLHEPTLHASKRYNIGLERLEQAYKMCNKKGLRYYTELVLGLPLETKETYLNGLMKLLELGQHDSVKTYLCTVIPNSEMAGIEYQEKYGIKLIYPEDLYRSPEERIWDEEDQSYENIAMVCETSTASKQDLADCLSYAWMISQFHYSGYSQIIAKYLYYIKKIPYRVFYDLFYQKIKEDKLGGELLSDVEEILINYLEEGKIPSNNKWGNVVALTLSESYGRKFIEDNKNYFIELSIKIGRFFSEIDQSIIDLQYAFIVDDEKKYPFIIKSLIDVDRWEYVNCEYKIYKRFSVSNQQDQMYEKFLRKTDIINLTNPFKENFNIDESIKFFIEDNNPVTVSNGRPF
jgi:putative methyltransferase